MSKRLNDWVGTEPVSFRDAEECVAAIVGASVIGAVSEAKRYLEAWTQQQIARARSSQERGT